MKILLRIKTWLLEWPFVSIREYQNAIKQRDKVIHLHYVKIQALELTIRNLQAELQLAQKNDRRDPKSGRFVRAH